MKKGPDLPPQPPNVFWLIGYVISDNERARRFIWVAASLTLMAIGVIIAMNFTVGPGWFGRSISAMSLTWKDVGLGVGGLAAGVPIWTVYRAYMRRQKARLQTP